MPFFLYGTGKQLHIDHVLLASPNVRLSADQVELSDSLHLGSNWTESSCVIAHFKDVSEQSMQPFPNNATIKLNDRFFFKPGSKFEVVLMKGLEGEPLGRGDITLGDFTFFDNDDVNRFPAAKQVDHIPKAPISGNPAKSSEWADVIVSLICCRSIHLLISLLGLYRRKDSQTA
jgi:hypothetical protein